MYSKLNDRIERMSKSIEFYFLKLQIIPQAAVLVIRTALNYYKYDLGEDSFDLPVQAVCVYIVDVQRIYIMLLYKQQELTQNGLILFPDFHSIGRHRLVI